MRPFRYVVDLAWAVVLAAVLVAGTTGVTRQDDPGPGPDVWAVALITAAALATVVLRHARSGHSPE